MFLGQEAKETYFLNILLQESSISKESIPCYWEKYSKKEPSSQCNNCLMMVLLVCNDF